MKKILRILIPVLIFLLMLLRTVFDDSFHRPFFRAVMILLMGAEVILSFIREYRPDQGPVRQGSAELISRRVDPWRVNYGNGTFYIAVFQVCNAPLELLTTEAEYRSLKEGSHGTLVWQGDEFRSFHPDPGP